jgi:hypothetical protein
MQYIDIGISAFDPNMLESYKKLKRLLDASTNAGIPVAQFHELFSQCVSCHRLMTDRSKEYHKCPSGPELCDSFNDNLSFLRLDCYSGGIGISEAHFIRLFPQCIHCDLFMTRWAALTHTCDACDAY